MNIISVATTNPGKKKEISDILKSDLEFIELGLDEVQSMDIAYVSKKKSEEAFSLLKKPVITDDVGVFIEAWNGFPGPFAKYILETLGNKNILKLLENEKNRNVVVKSAVSYHDGKIVHTFIGVVEGKLAFTEKGDYGWGFDPIIIPKGEKRTFGQMKPQEKNSISHRRKALDMFKQFLDSQNK
jgi:XTP/dITP diphosphohydrolase